MPKLITILTPCYNEEDNVNELYERILKVMNGLDYEYEHLFIDNCSTDGTVQKLRQLAKQDTRVKLILNVRNFGHVRSPYYGLLQASGDACIAIASDLQDPPEMIPLFLAEWEKGYRVVLSVKPDAKETLVMKLVRCAYYRFLTKISETPLIKNATGAGLYDQSVIEIIRKVNDPYPYLRGMLSEIGFPIATVPFTQPRRTKGLSKNNFYTLYDLAMLGITNHSKVPLRVMTMLGFLIALLSILTALAFFLAKLAYWYSFELGTAPLLIGIFFLGGVQLLFIGLLGEYIGSMHTKLRNMPLVVEAERVNFD